MVTHERILLSTTVKSLIEEHQLPKMYLVTGHVNT